MRIWTRRLFDEDKAFNSHMDCVSLTLSTDLFCYACMICSVNLISMRLIYRISASMRDSNDYDDDNELKLSVGSIDGKSDALDDRILHVIHSLMQMINNCAVDAQLTINDMKIIIQSCKHLMVTNRKLYIDIIMEKHTHTN